MGIELCPRVTLGGRTCRSWNWMMIHWEISCFIQKHKITVYQFRKELCKLRCRQAMEIMVKRDSICACPQELAPQERWNEQHLTMKKKYDCRKIRWSAYTENLGKVWVSIVEKGAIKSATQRQKAEPLFHVKIEVLIKLLEYRACGPCRWHRVGYTHLYCVLSIFTRSLIFANDFPRIAVLDGAITVLVSNGTVLHQWMSCWCDYVDVAWNNFPYL